MAADLFYFISSLPMLRLEGQCPLSVQEFLLQCRDLLGDDIAERLGKICLVPDNSEPVDATVAKWYAFETYLRNTLAELRRARMKLPPADTGRPNRDLLYSYKKRIEDAMALTPAPARENALDSLRYAFLEELEAEQYFNLASLEIYFLKLLILDKRSGRKLAEGRATFDNLLEAGFAQANEKRIGEI